MTAKGTIFVAIVKRPGLFYDVRDNGPMQQHPRFYTSVLKDHLQRHRQMAWVSGPRQVGKTTSCRSISDSYLNWDNADDRRQLLRGPAALAEALHTNQPADCFSVHRPVVVPAKTFLSQLL